MPKEAARLLVVKPGGDPVFADRYVGELADHLRPGDALVFNDTKVIHARLRGVRLRGAASATIEIMLHQRVGPSRWRAFARPGKKLNIGEAVDFVSGDLRLSAMLLEKGVDGDVLLQFDREGPHLDAAIARLGELPLPPYIAGKRAADAQDARDYQTVFARQEGAVAAPTAGLHMSKQMLAHIEAKGVSIHGVTLHVGAGTFLPVKVDDTDDHSMHAEWGSISAETASALNQTRLAGRRIVAIGTTSLRLLESAADADGKIKPFAGETRIFLTPGYRFRAVDLLMTNFHLPRSTLFMLVSAFCGLETMKEAYRRAIAGGYRFYSYGDASLLHRADHPGI